MLAAKDQYIDEAFKTIFRLSADEQIRKRCLDREEYYLDKIAMERTMKAQEAEIASYKTELADKNAELADQKAEIQRLRAEIEKLQNSGMQAN